MECLNYICNKHFTQKDSRSKKFMNYFTQFSIALLDGGHLEVQNQFYDYFLNQARSEYFFFQIQAKMNEEKNKKYSKTSIYAKVQNALARIEFCYEPYESKDDLKHLIRFLQLLCENHNTNNQNWLR